MAGWKSYSEVFAAFERNLDCYNVMLHWEKKDDLPSHTSYQTNKHQDHNILPGLIVQLFKREIFFSRPVNWQDLIYQIAKLIYYFSSVFHFFSRPTLSLTKLSDWFDLFYKNHTEIYTIFHWQAYIICASQLLDLIKSYQRLN